MQDLKRLYDSIQIPSDLNEQIMRHCRSTQAKPASTFVRYVMPVATLAACAAVLFVSLAATGRLLGSGELLPMDVPTQTTSSRSDTTVTNTTAPSRKGTTTQEATPETNPESSPAYKVEWYPGDCEYMSLAELEEYFGRRLQPSYLPQDLTLATQKDYRIWRRNEMLMQEKADQFQYYLSNGAIRDDAVIRDKNTLQYVGEGNRSLSVGVSTAPYPKNMLGDLTRFNERVSVGGVTVKWHYYDDSVYGGQQYAYSALAVVDGMEFYVNCWNIPREEFLKILESLLVQ